MRMKKEIAREEWLRTPAKRPEVKLGDFEVMPNHIHGIVILGEGGELVAPGKRPRALRTPCRGSLGAVLANFKGTMTKRIRRWLRKPHLQVWQRNYYDHIIRDGDDWERIRAYIPDNPINWIADPENPCRSWGRAAARPLRAWEGDLNRIAIILTGIMICTLLLCSCAKTRKEPAPESVPEPPAPPVSRERDDRPLIIAFGNSLTAGWLVPHDQAWPAQLRRGGGR